MEFWWAMLWPIVVGVVYTQGTLLKVAERVPFRLSRDVVAGMGATGVEGLFRNSCESVGRVLRRHSSTLLTVLEVCTRAVLARLRLHGLLLNG